jgi:hypothetical protein
METLLFKCAGCQRSFPDTDETHCLMCRREPQSRRLRPMDKTEWADFQTAHAEIKQLFPGDKQAATRMGRLRRQGYEIGQFCLRCIGG